MKMRDKHLQWSCMSDVIVLLNRRDGRVLAEAQKDLGCRHWREVAKTMMLAMPVSQVKVRLDN